MFGKKGNYNGFQTTKQAVLTGYGLPVAKTRAGQIASIFYILAGIPIFLIILKNVGILLSKFFRKLYKRIRSARRKLPENTYIQRVSVPVKVKYIKLKKEFLFYFIYMSSIRCILLSFLFLMYFFWFISEKLFVISTSNLKNLGDLSNNLFSIFDKSTSVRKT